LETNLNLLSTKIYEMEEEYLKKIKIEIPQKLNEFKNNYIEFKEMKKTFKEKYEEYEIQENSKEEKREERRKIQELLKIKNQKMEENKKKIK
jgi:hypothetical protein